MLCMCYDVGNSLGVVDYVVVEQQLSKKWKICELYGVCMFNTVATKLRVEC